MPTVTSLGVGAGMDLQGLLEGLMAVERQPLKTIQNKITSYNTTISALGTLSSKLSALRTAAQDLKPATLQTAMEKFATYTGSLANEKIGKVTVGEGAATGTHSLKVLSLSQGQKDIASGLTGAGGTLNFSFDNDGDASRSFSVNVAAGASLKDVASAINAQNKGISATVVGTQMILTGKDGIANEFSIADSGVFTSIASKYQTASDAAIEIDGITVTSQSNKFSDALTGVTIDISPDAELNVATTLSVSKNSEDKLQASLEAFVKAFNEAATSMNSLGAYNAETKTAGALQGQSILRDSQNLLANLVFGSRISTTDKDGNAIELSLSDIGIAFKGDRQLSIDTDKLKAAIAANPEGLAKFAAGIGAKFDESLNNVVGTGGRIQMSKDGLSASIRMQEDRYEAMERRLEKVEERYRTQFSALDTLVSKMNSTSSWLAQSLATLPK